MLYKKSLIIPVCLLFICCACFYSCSPDHTAKVHIGTLSSEVGLSLFKNKEGDWGIKMDKADTPYLIQPKPIGIEHYMDSSHIEEQARGYAKFEKRDNGFIGKVELKMGSIAYRVTDTWTITNDVLALSRDLKVEGNAPGGFLSAITFQKVSSGQEQYFVPGMIFGNKDDITKSAIGGRQGGNSTWIREDRMPAPLFGIYSKDGTSISILDPTPQGQTTKEDSRDRKVKTIVDGSFRFGSLGVEKVNDRIDFGFKWPGSEGETTYRGYYFPGGQVKTWRRRYHPLKDGFEQHYTINFRIDKASKSFTGYYNRAWLWAWDSLSPKVNMQDIGAVRKSLIKMLSQRVENRGGITGIPNIMGFESVKEPGKNPNAKRKSIMGFAGRTIESATFLLHDTGKSPSLAADNYRKKGLDIINSFLKLKLDPPEGIGYLLNTGEPVGGVQNKIFIRYLGDGLKALLKCAKREKLKDISHPDWIAWARSFANWLLPQQNPSGSFPRAWEIYTGKVIDSSPQSTYTVIPYLLLLHELTGDIKYKEAAVKAGNFCWENGQSSGVFVGGTVDNPNVIDKEAGTLSLEAYLELYSSTHDKKWLKRAKMAANFSEIWMYIWNVPMPEDEENKDLHWKKGVSTVGLQLISTGHSLVDAYMAYDANEYAELALLTKNQHYMDIAAILLHNTKAMIGIPGRLYDLPGPGWQQEHWSLAPERGMGRKRAWLPWVSTSHLNGIFELGELDKNVFKKLSEKGRFDVERDTGIELEGNTNSSVE